MSIEDLNLGSEPYIVTCYAGDGWMNDDVRGDICMLMMILSARLLLSAIISFTFIYYDHFKFDFVLRSSEINLTQITLLIESPLLRNQPSSTRLCNMCTI